MPVMARVIRVVFNVCTIILLSFYFEHMRHLQRALVGDSAAREHRATAYGLYHMVVGLAALPGAVLFGALWQWVGEMAAVSNDHLQYKMLR